MPLFRGIRGGVDEFLRVHRREFQSEISRQQTPGVDHLVDEIELLLGLPDNRLARADVARLVQRLALDELGPSDDAVERAAQVVGDYAEVIIGETVDLQGRPLLGIFSTFGRAGGSFVCFASAGHPRLCTLHANSFDPSTLTLHC